jgi:hypothetical protein
MLWQLLPRPPPHAAEVAAAAVPPRPERRLLSCAVLRTNLPASGLLGGEGSSAAAPGQGPSHVQVQEGERGPRGMAAGSAGLAGPAPASAGLLGGS